jgi:Flp pilus assembly protein TadD
MYEELADISLYEDQIPKAEEYIAVARGLHPDSSTGIYLLGCISSRKGDMKSAIVHFTEANNRFANNSEILRHLGWAYVVDGEHARGVMFLRRAYTLAPKDQRVGEDLGVSLLTDPVGTEKTIAE